METTRTSAGQLMDSPSPAYGSCGHDRGGRLRYVFGTCELDVARYELRRGGAVVHIQPQVFGVLRYLLEHRDRVVPKTELLDAVWGDRFISEAAGPPSGSALAAQPNAAARDQEIRYCRSPGGVRIAYATTGSGPPLVKAANWLTHLDLERDSVNWGHWIDALSARHQLVRYDERGCGLSDWQVGEFSLQDWVEDLELVVASAGLTRFPLIGLSQGCAVAISYAVRHPEQVSRLVLVGGYARGRLIRARTAEEREEAALDLQVGRVAWRRDDPAYRQVFAAQFLPDESRQTWDAFSALQRATTSTGNVVRFLDTFARIDVSGPAARVRCPPLILHSRRDQRVPAQQARELAAQIPGSILRLADSGNHILTAREPAWPVVIHEIERFLS